VEVNGLKHVWMKSRRRLCDWDTENSGDIFADCTITARRCRVWLWHGLLINIIIMQRLTRHVSGMRMTNRRFGSVHELGWVGVDRNLDCKVVAWKHTTGSRTTLDLLSRQSNPWPLHHQATHNIVDWCWVKQDVPTCLLVWWRSCWIYWSVVYVFLRVVHYTC